MDLLAMFLYSLMYREVAGVKFNSLAHAGLPPQSPYFVPRDEPTRQIVEGLLGNNNVEQRIMVLSGMGGSGKSQLSIHFANKYQKR